MIRMERMLNPFNSSYLCLSVFNFFLILTTTPPECYDTHHHERYTVQTRFLALLLRTSSRAATAETLSSA